VIGSHNRPAPDPSLTKRSVGSDWCRFSATRVSCNRRIAHMWHPVKSPPRDLARFATAFYTSATSHPIICSPPLSEPHRAR
jgi:hypothetical protein